jgi:hypothetical protein
VIFLSGAAFAQMPQPSSQLTQLPAVRNNPPAPSPEPVLLDELPLPPTAPSSVEGACSASINPHGTGCIAASDNGILEGPSYMWDGKHVLLAVVFTGAPAAPDPASIYSGPQVLAIKTDGTLFANGDPWKCITCGISAGNRKGVNVVRTPGSGALGTKSAPAFIFFDHPQAFRDDHKMIAGTNVVDCGTYNLSDAACTPERIHIYPIRFALTANAPPGPGMRELRLHPDSVHLGFSAFVPGRFDEFALMGRLEFVPAAVNDPADAPHYEVRNVNILLNTSPDFAFFRVDPKNPGILIQNKPHGAIGEFRGWSSDGQWALGNYWVESGNVDLFKTNLATGESVRITRDPAYTDPMKASPDDRWSVVMDARQGGRHMYYAGMRGIPPLVDLLTMSVMTCCYNDGNRRFFQPYLIDVYGDRGNYHGQQLNAGPGNPGSPSDPNWNGRADPAWSPDGTNVVYWQALVTAPACGNPNRQPCPDSTEPGGRRTRLMIARLTSREPITVPRVAPVADVVPWAIQFRTGDRLPLRAVQAPAGKFKLPGKVSGSADVEIRHAADGSGVAFVSVRYSHFTNDGFHIIDGTESAEKIGSDSSSRVVWHSDLRASGLQHGSKVTSEPGGFIPPGFGSISSRTPPVGSLTTTIDGAVYSAPYLGP